MNNIIAGNVAEHTGGGIFCWDSTPKIINNTITGNSVEKPRYGGGCAVYCSGNSSLTIINTILWNTGIYEVALYSGSNFASISHSDVQGGEMGIDTNDNGTVKWLEGNIDEDPMFISVLGGDFYLSNSSPCVGAGTMDGAPMDDIEGNPRPDPPGSQPDIGAYESIVNAGMEATAVEPMGKVSTTWGSIKAK